MALHLSEALNWVWAKPKILSQCFSDSFIVCRSFIFATSHDSVHPLTWCCSRLQRVTSVSASNILLIFSHNKVIQKSQDCVTKTWKPLQKTYIELWIWLVFEWGISMGQASNRALFPHDKVLPKLRLKFQAEYDVMGVFRICEEVYHGTNLQMSSEGVFWDCFSELE